MSLKMEASGKAVRRIPVNVRSLTGRVNGQEFESSLERDLLLLVHWDFDVDWYQVQPLKIEYVDAKGSARQYTPDLFVSYRAVKGAKVQRKPLLCEVKYRDDIAKQWKLLKPKLKAARKYARERGWDFSVLTEREIRTPYLKNVQFLWSYRFAHFHEHHYEHLRLTLEELGESDVNTLLEVAYSSKALRGEALWTLWCMVARRWVKCDLNELLTMQTVMWVDS